MCNVLQSFGDEGHPLIGWPQGSEVLQKKTAFSSPGSYFFTARNDCQVNERMDRLPHGYIERNAYIYIYIYVHIILLMVQKSGDHQLRLVVYPIIYRVLAPSQVVVRDFWTINGVNKTNFHVKQFRMPSLEFGLPSPQSVSQFDPNCCASSDFLIPNPTTPPTDYFCRTSSHPWQFCEFCGRKETDRIRRLSKNFQRFLSFFFLSKKNSHRCFWKVTYYAQTSLPMQEQLWIVTPSQQGRVVLKGARKANQKNMGEVFPQKLIVVVRQSYIIILSMFFFFRENIAIK